MRNKTAKLISVFIALVMVVGLLPMTVHADSRTIIPSIEATSNISSIAVSGNAITAPVFTIETGSPARVNTSSSHWWKKNGETWEMVDNGTFTPGTWRYKVQLRIDAADGANYKLAEPPTVKVDGQAWTVPGSVFISDTVSYTDIQSPEFTITDDGGLNFTSLSNYNIPQNFVGTPITSYSVASSVSGGTAPYVFSKTSGPDWIIVDPDGTVRGTPSTPGSNSNMFIRVTDSASNWKEINVTVGDTLSSSKTIISTIEGRSYINDVAVNGNPINTVSFMIDIGSPAYFKANTGKWYKKNGDTWEIVDSGNFTPGTWRYTVQLRIDGDDGLTHQISTNPTVIIDGVNWIISGSTFISDTTSYVNMQSPEITITSTQGAYNVTVNSGTADVTTVASGTTVTLTAGTAPAGKVFEKWVVNSGTITLADATSATTTFTMPEENVEVTATYKDISATTYTVSFDANSGNGTMADVTLNEGEKLTLPNCTFTPPSEDKVFDKWDAGTPGEQVDITSDCIIRAIWKDKEVTPFAPTITTSTLPNGKVDEAYGQSLAVTGDTPITWSLESGSLPVGLTLGTDGTISGTPTTAGDYTFTVKASNAAGADSKEYTITIAPADAVTYAVTFDANGHGTAPAALTVASGNTASKPSDPTASGWAFGGWYQDATCSIAFDFATPITANITLYAKWTENSVTPITHAVTFETNGGSAVVAQAVDDGEKATKPTDPTKEGFVFDGWYQDATLSVAFSFDTPITADITLYAKWTEDTPSTVYYTVVGGGNSSFTSGNASDLVVTVKRSEADETCFSHFTGVQIDGVALVNGTDYTAVAGSTVVTIKAATLNNLSEGGHTINVLFDDGKTETSVTVKAAGTNNNSNTNGNKAIPATGETLAPTLFVGIAFIAVAVTLFAVILVQKKRKSVR